MFAEDDGDDPAMTALMDVLAAHTRFVDEFLADAGRAGIRQVVILASGLDTRPYRLWWPRGTTVYEIDQPQVLDFKAEVLRGLDAELATHRCAIGIDLGQDWPAALRRVGFDAAATHGLGRRAVARRVPAARRAESIAGRHHRRRALAGSRFTADHMPTWNPLQLGAERAFVDGWRQRGLDVDLASLTYPGEYHYVPEYLASNGWETAGLGITELLGAMGLGRRRRTGSGDAEFIPEYITATRV